MPNVPIRATGEAAPAVSRRAFLRTSANASAAVVAASGIAVLTSSSQAAEHPDAELVALGIEFDALFAQYKSSTTKAEAASEAFQAARPAPTEGGPAFEAWWADYSVAVDGDWGPSDEWSERVAAVTEKIRALSATTLAGFAVKARTLRFDLAKWGDSPEPMLDWDWDDESLERFVREIEAAGGGRTLA
ncbi:hypothetical protein [Aureimonas leprariae]|uniref:Uncharacterized protein n=1 Tax=Plantimonas leprariae TaxID=2615207 RepID=A0A7V7PQ32_9HYPH|nr:hypothetical protein [Aureimonas leprariae]KAB0680177.1 hypothetical protein F6X38_08280 [Aureimonas leprariae]